MQSSRKSVVVSRWLAKTTCCLAGAFIRPVTVKGYLRKCRKSLKPQRTRRTAAEIADTRDCQALGGYEDAIPGRLANAAQLWPIGSNRKLMALILRDLCGCSPRPLRFKIF